METGKENILGTEKISKLLMQFSIPTVLTLIVNCLYNIVDQIFVGRAVGINGVAATNVAFPMITISAALALMVGDGCAANISLCLGRKERDKAEQTFGNAFVLLILAGFFWRLSSSSAALPAPVFLGHQTRFWICL